MRVAGLQGALRGRVFRTTKADATANRPPDLVCRDFTAVRPNALWLVDFTYVPTWSGMAFTAFVSDAYSRRIVVWRTAASMPTQLSLDALEMALWTRTRAGEEVRGLIHHSDAGSQGEFKWSSQHLECEGVADGSESGAADESCGAGADAVSGAAAGEREGGAAAVLGPDRSGSLERGCGGRSGCVDMALSSPSRRYLSFAEREEIPLMRACGAGVRQIARDTGRSSSTISRELRRNAATRAGRLDYRASVAQWHAEARARRPKVAKLAVNQRLREYVQDRLAGAVVDPYGRPIPGPNVPWKGRRHARSPRGTAVGNLVEPPADQLPSAGGLPR